MNSESLWDGYCSFKGDAENMKKVSKKIIYAQIYTRNIRENIFLDFGFSSKPNISELDFFFSIYECHLWHILLQDRLFFVFVEKVPF